jgi:FkbH-like protein/FkbM family methyltransferase
MQTLLRIVESGPHRTRIELRIRPATLQLLRDHKVHGVPVLPGALFIETALLAERELTGSAPRRMRGIRFLGPVVAPDNEAVLTVDVVETRDATARYSFHESVSGTPDPSCVAELEVERCGRRDDEVPAIGGLGAADVHDVSDELDVADFYRSLSGRGNQYGPAFRRIAALHRAADRWIGRVDGPTDAPEGSGFPVHPGVLDAAVQMLAPYLTDRDEAFVLKSIDEIRFGDGDPRGPLRMASMASDGEPNHGPTFTGRVRAMDALGRPCFEMIGITLALIGHPSRGERPAPLSATRIVVASNFTAEPVGDTIRFWGDALGSPFDLRFAPYNQPFQQLLDPASDLSTNVDGFGVMMLALEEWTKTAKRAPPRPSSEALERALGDRARWTLPNGMRIAHLNRYETEYLYDEIFVDGAYLKHGIRLDPGCTVIDVGANIGLFSLFVVERCPGATVYACEPAPRVHDLLAANLAAYGSNATALKVGVSDRRGTGRFTFYEKSSVFSGFHSDKVEDAAAIRTVVRNMLQRRSVDDEALEDLVDELTADRVSATTCDCELVSVSDLIREHGIGLIDLLKIDAEKSELDVLAGIDAADWPRIRQIVIEIHDPTGAAIGAVERLLVDKGFGCAVEQEQLLERSGLFNLYAIRREQGGVIPEVATQPGSIAPAASTARIESLDGTVREFSDALRAFRSRSSLPLVLCLAPPDPSACGDAGLAEALRAAEARLASVATALPGIEVLGSATLSRWYPLQDWHDPEGRVAGHVPYTTRGFAALGTAVVRKVAGHRRPPIKVVVLDCDNTLWGGVCGEDGAAGVELSAPFLAVQAFAVRLVEAGVLVCLCSKNEERDVLEVFDRRPEMLLRREHVAAWRVDWRSKSEGIRSLAKELNLALDSFAFVDDNPVECADVAANCPEVLVLRLPGDPPSMTRFLEHVWALDTHALTAEDANRTRMYQDEARRTRYREQAMSLAAFIDGLGLRIDATAPLESQLERAAQLTLRTNQFNFTTVRRSVAELKAFLDEPGAQGLVVHVGDRFGDYGLVGLLLYRLLDDRLAVDTFLLSCRVLGRGVEHALAARLGRIALENGLASVEFTIRPTERNEPARAFARSIAPEDAPADAVSWLHDAVRLARTAYAPGNVGAQALEPMFDESARHERSPAESGALAFDALRSRAQDIAERLSDVDRIVAAVDAFRSVPDPSTPPGALSEGTPTERTLATIWGRVLGRASVGLDENFFEAGGTSLIGVQVIAAVKRELGRRLSIVSLFESPTVRLLAARLDGRDEPGAADDVAGRAAMERGRQRRYGALKRRGA